MSKRTSHILGFIILFIILINVFDFFELLNPFWDFVKKILSLFMIFAFIYMTSPSSIFLGERRRIMDALYSLSFFAMIMKDVVGYAVVAKSFILEHITRYAVLSPLKSASSFVVEKVSEASMNSIHLLNIIPNAGDVMSKYAGNLTLTNPSVAVNFVSGNSSSLFSLKTVGLSGAMLNIYNAFLQNSAMIERWSFIIGVVLLFFISIFAAYKVAIKKESLAGVLGMDKPGFRVFKVLALFFIGLAFFIIVVNLLVEWLAIAIDAPILMVMLAVFIYYLLGSHDEIAEQGFTRMFGNFGSGFYSDFLNLFKKKRGILIALSGILVLHLLSEIFIFLFPYILGISDILYFLEIGAGHSSLWVLINSSLPLVHTLLDRIAMTAGYILSYVGMFMLLLIPAYIWYKIFMIYSYPEENEPVVLKPWMLSLFFSSVPVLLLFKAFSIRGFSRISLIGVDIFTRTIRPSFLLFDIKLIIAASVLLFIIVLLLSRIRIMKIVFSFFTFISSIVFLAYYAFLFLKSTAIYYFTNAVSLAHQAYYVLSFFLFLFLIMLSVFYIVSVVSFLYEFASR